MAAAFLESWSLQLGSNTKMLPQLKSFFYIHCGIYSLSHTLGGMLYRLDATLCSPYLCPIFGACQITQQWNLSNCQIVWS